jgi:hypothetical protein
MTTPYDKIKAEFDELVLKYKEAIADGKLSFSDALSLLLHGSFSIAQLLQNYVELDFEKRKAIGVDLAVQFYDEVIAPIDLPLPNLIEPIFDRTLAAAIPGFIGVIYDSVDALVYQKLE